MLLPFGSSGLHAWPSIKIVHSHTCWLFALTSSAALRWALGHFMGHTMGFLVLLSSHSQAGLHKEHSHSEGSVLAMKPFPWVWASRVAPAEAFRERNRKRTGKVTCSWCGRFSGFTEDHRKLPWHLCCICDSARGQRLRSPSWPAFLVKEGPGKCEVRLS